MGTIRQMKKKQKPIINHQLNLPFVESVVFDRGFQAGAKEQRESDINFVIGLLEDLEAWPGIGKITASKIRQHFLEKFGFKEESILEK